MSMTRERSEKKTNRIAMFFILLFFAVVIVYAVVKGRIWEDKEFYYNKSLNEKILTVDGEVLTLEDLAFYIAYEELSVDKQAKIYSPDNPKQYWNLHTNGVFIKLEAKQRVIDMAVHDAIFYAEAQKLGLTLDEEEQERLAASQMDFWYDMTEEQQESLGVLQEVLNESMYRVAIAEKYQNWISEDTGILYDSFRAAGTAYEQQVLPEHTYEVEQLWDEVPFGSIIVS